MNEVIRNIDPERVTLATLQQMARRWTTAELVQLAELGAFRDEDRFELIDGEIVAMSPVGRRHEVVAEVIGRYMRQRETAAFHVVKQGQLNLSAETYCEPDIWVKPSTMFAYDVLGPQVLLVVEVAKSSLDFDTGAKTAAYARHGVRDYWVVDADTLATRVHREPDPAGYGERRNVPPSETITALLAPELAICMSALGLD